MENGSVLAPKVMTDVKASIKVQLLNGDWVNDVAEVELSVTQDATFPQIAGAVIKQFLPTVIQLGGIAAETKNDEEPLDFIPIGSILRIRPTFPRITTATQIPKGPIKPSKIIV